MRFKGRMFNGGDMTMTDRFNLQNGSNDNMLWAATDGEGLQWTPYAVSYYHNRGVPDRELHFTPGVNSSLSVNVTEIKTPLLP